MESAAQDDFSSATEALRSLQQHIEHQVIGQENLVNRLLIAMLADGHLLVEGAPGLAKTRAIRTLETGVEGDFHRIQFTPDLLPGDLTGNEVYRPQDGSFHFEPGPLFHNLILADEINRAPAKVQSALLEAMGERQITVGSQTFDLPALFLVMATQNPIEQEGTYPLPEAQLDRFLMHVQVDYPRPEDEQRILNLAREEARWQSQSANRTNPTSDRVISQAELFTARRAALAVHMSEQLEQYLIQLVLATRNAGAYGEHIGGWLEFGASPRATIALDRCARAHALLQGRDFVDPADVQSVAYDVLRHRLILRFEAEADGITPDRVVSELLQRIAVP